MMMGFIYNLSISGYKLLISAVAPFNPKAKQWIDGRKDIFFRLEDKIKGNQQIAWFHCASLGEFEQGRPVIEKLKEQQPKMKILLTFFSPSGYEIRKNYDKADWVFYLPLDTKSNAAKFLDIVKPEMAIFVKYEFWYHYINEMHKRKIPVFSISAIFRPNQIFFKSWAGWYQNILKKFSHIFVQNENSEKLLKSIGIEQVTIAGDTRFDRVAEIARAARELPLIKSFKNDKTLILAGSTWQPDEEILARFINACKNDIRFVIAPHEIHTSNIIRLKSLIQKKTLRYSQANDQNIFEAEVLIIDNIGMLSSAYQYANAAYIGGGFGVGIHNTLEAATFGLPVIFGPNYQKFKEAVDLVSCGGAFSINDYESLAEILQKLIDKQNYCKESGTKSAIYVKNNVGATSKILEKIAELKK
jgi:3-deoxy-D-manno-octulosonic-acid transferase